MIEKNLSLTYIFSIANPIISAAYGGAAGAGGGAAPGGAGGDARPADEVEERPEELD